MERQAVIRALAAAVLLMAGAHCMADGLTLRQCIDAAYGLSPALKSELLDIDAAGQEIIKQRTALLPSLTASAYSGVMNGNPISPFAIVTGEDIENGLVSGNTREVQTSTTRTTTTAKGKSRTGTTNSSTVANTTALPHQLLRADWAPYSTEHVELDYPLFQNGSILGLNDAPAIAYARAAKQGLVWTRQLGEEKVVFDLCNAFFIAQWYQEKLARDEARVHFSQKRLEIVKLQFQLQLMLQQDVDLAKTQLEQDEATLTATKRTVRDSWAVLAVMIGQPAQRVAKLGGNPPAFPTLPPLDGLLKAASELHPSIGLQQSVIDQARATYKLDQAALYPTVAAATSYTFAQNLAHIDSSSANAPSLYAAGVTVNVPIFDWGSRLAEERESRIKLSSAQAQEDQVKMDISTAIARLYDGIHMLDMQLATAIESQVSDANATQLARQQAATGALAQLAVVTDEETLLSAEDTVENTRLAELETYTQLEQAAGGAWKWQQ